jgi:hypothetical protein
MKKAAAALFISVSVLVPAFAYAKSSHKAPKDTTPPSVQSVHVQSDNADSSAANPGDRVTLSFTASEKVTPVVLVETHTLFVRAHNTSGNSWDASYTVGSRDPNGRVDYLIALLDTAGNASVCSSARLLFIKRCPTTDGSSVTVSKDTTPPPPTDTTAPVIDGHEDVRVETTQTSAEVSYDAPAATDDTDGTVGVSCAPASGTTFEVGTTTVTCSAQDAAGNTASSTFAVIVVQVPPTPYVMASQDDESFLCSADSGSWRICDPEETYGFTDATTTGIKTIDLGQGSNMGTGMLQTVTIAKDPAYSEVNLFHPWQVTLNCFSDAAHTDACSDWTDLSDTAHNNPSGDGVHWVADFSSLERTFNQDDYYTLTINDKDWETPAYGSESLKELYWVIAGVH